MNFLIYIFFPEDLAEEADIYFNHPFGEKPLRFCAPFLKCYKREQDPDISEASDVLVLPNQILPSCYETRPFVRQNAGQKSSRAYACHGAEALNLELKQTSSRLQTAYGKVKEYFPPHHLLLCPCSDL